MEPSEHSMGAFIERSGKVLCHGGLDNFIMGLKRELAVRIRGGHPGTLQEAINLGRTAEWEIERESTLDRKDLGNFSQDVPSK